MPFYKTNPSFALAEEGLFWLTILIFERWFPFILFHYLRDFVIGDRIEVVRIYTYIYNLHLGVSSVEPVFGILTQFMGMRKVNTRGITQANKCMHLAAIAYNLKKLLKHTKPKAASKQGVGQKVGEGLHFLKTTLQNFIGFILRPSDLG